MKIKTIFFEDGSSVENGSYPDNTKKVMDIVEHRAQGEGDKWYWEVTYSNGEIFRFFSVDSVLYESTED